MTKKILISILAAGLAAPVFAKMPIPQLEVPADWAQNDRVVPILFHNGPVRPAAATTLPAAPIAQEETIAAESSPSEIKPIAYRQGTFRTTRDCVLHYIDIFTKPCNLYYQTWAPAPPTATRGVLVMVHGFGEHSGRYKSLAQFFVAQGFAVYTYDQRGNGVSPGLRGHVSDWDDYRQDLADFMNNVRAEQPALPLFLFGHSLGALEVLDYAEQYPDRDGIRGVIVSGPPVMAPPLAKLKQEAGEVLANIPAVGSEIEINAGLNVNALTHDDSVVQDYRNDRRNHADATPAFNKAFQGAARNTMTNADMFRLPILMLYGADDQIVPPAGSREFFSRLNVQDKQIIDYPGSFHEIHNEFPQTSLEERADILHKLNQWLE